MGYNLFQRGASRAGAAEDDFASTVASLPADEDSRPAEPAPPDSQAAVDSQPAADSQPADSQPAEARPTLAHIGRYALKGPLGAGGLGQVHEAWDPLLSRLVAVKTLQFDTDPRERVALDGLFLNEARAVAGLSHPHIVTIYDAGLSAHGVYIAMERLHGRDLRQALAAGWQPTPAQSALLVRRVADALAYAHARGVVHCDIKPANIFLTRRDKPKVLDFGIAKVAHRQGGKTGTAAPFEGFVLGSPHYLAPEQLRGEEVDARTDIHALGVVFYELLAGRRAFGGDNVEQIGNAILTLHPAPPHTLRPGVPPALSAIAARAMARAPDERYPNALAMALELRRWIEQQGGDAAANGLAPPRRGSARKRTQADLRTRRRALLWTGTALAGAALLAVGLGAARREPPPAAAAPALPPPPAATSPAPTPHPGLAAAETLATPPVVPEAAATAEPTPNAAATPRRAAAPPAARRAEPPRRSPAAATATSAATETVAAPPATGTLQLAISPWGEIEVNGKPLGTAPPLSRLTLPAGLHTVTVRNADFPPHTVQIEVEADRAVTVRHRFGS